MFISSQYIIKDWAISDSYVASIIRNTVYWEWVNGIK
jgi:hypothetical protein